MNRDRRRGQPVPTDPAHGADSGSGADGTSAPAPASGCLWVVATPIGTLDDLSPRAVEILRGVHLVVAEDTRRARKLLSHFGISTATRSLHEHNEVREVPQLLRRLAAGDSLALISDAGTPLVSDPGFRLVRACRESGLRVLAVPGPSAVTAALSVAGLPPYPFSFLGFLPAAAGARRRFLESAASLTHTVVLFLSPHRLASELSDCAAVLGGEREAALLAELSKLHERYLGGPLHEVAAAAARDKPRGEYTLVVGPGAVQALPTVDAAAARSALEEALATGASLQDARRLAARALGISRRELYALLSGDQ